MDGHFWYFKYPVIDPKPGEPTHVTVATTRPETMLGDTAVAVHPDPAAALGKAEADLNERLASAPSKDKPAIEEQIEEVKRRRQEMLPMLVTLRDMALAGRKIMLPLQNKEIPLVADDWAKPELGTGCVKITPAHDSNDYEVGLRQNLLMVNILNPDGTLSAEAGKYQGLDMMEAREKVVADLQALGLVAKIEDRQIEIAHSDRSKTPIEPYLTDQWFVKMDELAQSAMDAVTDGRVKIIPERYGKGYLDWLGEKRDWPIGRQLWWGHRIPVWTKVIQREYNKQEGAETDSYEDVDETPYLKDEYKDQICTQVIQQPETGTSIRFYCIRPGNPELEAIHEAAGYTQDSDVLDTWFSSALWPHSTMGWPEQTAELKYYYPTNVLITSRDIITLWVARMVLTGLYNVGEIPFHEVFIHPKILDGYGEGMSKSKGNGVDPLDVIDKFGADSLRFGIAYLTTETQDIRMPVDFECPHCGKLIEQTKDNRVRPKLKCKECGKEFSTQWAEKPEHKALPRGAVVSDRFELARNFCNKLWNASRFAMMNLAGFTPGKVADGELFVEDAWILSRLATVTKGVTDGLAEYRYADAARVLYDFAWDEFCSFYVEMVKGRLQSDTQRPVAQRVLAHTLDTLLRLLHPMIPFLTEEVWQRLGEIAPRRALGDHHPAAESIMIAPWPEYDAHRQNPEIEARFARFQEVLRAVRDIRSRQNVPPKTDLAFSVRCDAATAALLKPMEPYFATMAGANAVAWGPDVNPPELSANVALSGMEVFVDLAGLIDIDAEIARNSKEVERLAGFIAAKEKKLSNANFVDRAPADVVQKERDSLADLQSQQAAANEVLERLAKLKK